MNSRPSIRRGRLGILLALLSAAAAASGAPLPPCTVRIEGVGNRALRRELLEIADTWKTRRHPPAGLRLLQRRANGDAEQMRLLLRTRGYYGARVRAEVVPRARRSRVTFHAQIGPVFLLDAVAIQGLEDEPPAATDLGLPLNRPAEARAILLAEQELVRLVQDRGHPMARVADRRVEADHAAARVRVTFVVDPGPAAVFGATRVSGLQHLRESFVRRAIPWEEGGRYAVEEIERFRRRLYRSGIFSAVSVGPRGAPDPAGRQAMSVELRERRRRTIELGVGYMSDRGAGARAAWTHRNLLGGGEQWRSSLDVSESAAALETSFLRPHFLGADQDLLIDLKAEREQPEAYESRRLTASALVDRYLSETWRAKGGLALRLSEVEQGSFDDNYLLFAVPLEAQRDVSDDLFDPREGGRLLIGGEPVLDLLNAEATFFRGRLVLTRYEALGRRSPWTAAFRLGLGALFGSSRGDVPADERFYAGGGGSIRGYAYQKVGPLNEDGKPLGGRSLLELSLEARWRMSESMGWALFVDGGTAFEAAWPDLEETLRWGAGLGWRYFSPVGLVRVDVGLPLNGRKDIDDAYQLYVSIGQAF